MFNINSLKFKILLTTGKWHKETRRVVKLFNEHLVRSNNISEIGKVNFNKLKATLKVLNYSKRDRYDFYKLIQKVRSYNELFEVLGILTKAKSFGLDRYINVSSITKLLNFGKDYQLFFDLAKSFDNYNLEEEGQADFEKLAALKDVEVEHLREIVRALITTKKAGYPLKLKDIVKYYDSGRPFTLSQVENLSIAWILIKEHSLPVTINDFIFAGQLGWDPVSFVKAYNLLYANDIPIDLNKLSILYKAANTNEIITLLFKIKNAEIYQDFKTIYTDIELGRDVAGILKTLIRLHNAGIDYVHYNHLRNYSAKNRNFDKLIEAIIFNHKNKIVGNDELMGIFNKIVHSIDNPETFNPLNMLKAITMGKAFDLSKEDVVTEYLQGINVFSLIFHMQTAQQKNINVSYPLAKLFEQGEGFLNVLQKAINPFIFEQGEIINITTKDNVEIKLHLNLQVILKIDNYFRGSDEKVLFSRAKAICIDEIQRQYNHNEIIMNIEKISNNILYRLVTEKSDKEYIYFTEKQMIRVVGSHEHSHNDEYIEEHSVNEQSHSEYNEFRKIEHHKEEKNAIRFIDTSKYKPLKVIIDKIEFVEETFKKLDQAKHEFELHMEKAQAEIEKIKAEIKIKEAWARSENLKYYFLKNEEEEQHGQSGEHH